MSTAAEERVEKRATTSEILGDAQTQREAKKLKLEEIDTEAIDKIVLAEDLQKGGTIRIERRGPFDQEYAFLVKIPAEEWGDTGDRIELCKQMFGGGDYRCRTFRDNGQMYKSFGFKIDARFKGNLDDDEMRKLRDTNNTGKEDVVTKLMAVMKPNGDSFSVRDMLLLQEKSAGKDNQMMTLMMTMMMESQKTQSQTMATMFSALATMNSGQKSMNSEALVLELIKKNTERTPMTETLAMMAQIKDLFEKPETDKEPETMFDKLLKYGGPALAALAGNAVKVLPQGQPVAQGTSVAQQPRLGGLMALAPQDFKILIGMGIKAAEKGSDPGLYFDLLVDQLDEDKFNFLKETLTSPDWCAKMFGDETQVAHIRPWLDDLREMITQADYASLNSPTPSASGPAPSAPVAAGPPAA